MNDPLPYTKELLRKIAQESLSYSDMLRKTNRRPSGGNTHLLKKLISEWNVDISHFPNASDRARLTLASLEKREGMPNEEWFINGKQRNNTHSKSRLFTSGLKQRECEFCAQGEYWRGKYMGLILDHVDGDNTNNLIENLRILCPNCNATLATHCGRLTVKKPKIVKVEKPKAAKLRPRKVERPPLEVLLEEVKLLGYTGTGRKYGVSDNAVRKWIKTSSG